MYVCVCVCVLCCSGIRGECEITDGRKKAARVHHRPELEFHFPSLPDNDTLGYDEKQNKWFLSFWERDPIANSFKHDACLELVGIRQPPLRISSRWGRVFRHLDQERALALVAAFLFSFPTCVHQLSMWIELVKEPGDAFVGLQSAGPLPLSVRGCDLGSWSTPIHVVRGDRTYPMSRAITLENILFVSTMLPSDSLAREEQHDTVCGVCDVFLDPQEQKEVGVWLSDAGSSAHKECIVLASPLDVALDTALDKAKSPTFKVRARVVIRRFCQDHGLSLRRALEDASTNKLLSSLLLDKFIALSIATAIV